MADRGSQGIGKLAAALDNRLKEYSSAGSDFTADFGKISSNYSLVCNTFGEKIPPDEYSVCALRAGDGSASKLKKGDRVLVIWVQGEPVVIDKVKRGKSLK